MSLFTTILNCIDTGAPLVALLFFIKPFKRMPKELYYIFWFIFLQFIANLTAKLLEEYKINNYSVYLANVILSFCVLSFFFYNLRNYLIKKIIPFAAFSFILCAAYSIAKGDGIASYNSALSAVGSFLIIGYCLSYFYWRLIKDARLSGLTDGSLFWMIVGLFTYYTGSFFIFISYKYLIVQGDEAIGVLWRFHNLLLTIFCIYTIYGIVWKDLQKT